jgi:hypothetical protein
MLRDSAARYWRSPTQPLQNARARWKMPKQTATRSMWPSRTPCPIGRPNADAPLRRAEGVPVAVTGRCLALPVTRSSAWVPLAVAGRSRTRSPPPMTLVATTAGAAVVVEAVRVGALGALEGAEAEGEVVLRRDQASPVVSRRNTDPRPRVRNRLLQCLGNRIVKCLVGLMRTGRCKSSTRLVHSHGVHDRNFVTSRMS